MIDAISHHKDFVESSLDRILEENPLGFIDIGSVGGVHPLILPLAGRSQCTCFEPDPASYRELSDMYSAATPFMNLTIHNSALGAGHSQANLYLTRSPVASSLLEPDQEFASRYRVQGLHVDRMSSVKVDSLDHVLATEGKTRSHAGEFIKIDCQGVEFDVLTGASKTLDNDCVAIFCEVEFASIYKGQKVFPEIDAYLKSKGFLLYGLHPHFISSRRLNRIECETEERLLWADALYFKDPLQSGKERDRRLCRQIQVLFLVAVLTHYYDYAMEILESFDWSEKDRKHLTSLVLSCSRNRKETLEKDADKLVEDLLKTPPNKYLTVKKFIDVHRSSSDIDFIAIDH